MIRCEDAKEYISLKLDDELNNAEKKELHQHLSQCASCKSFEEELNFLHQDLLNLNLFDVSPKESMVDQLLQNNKIDLGSAQTSEETTNKEKKNIITHTDNKGKKRWPKPFTGLVVAAALLAIFIPMSSLLNWNQPFTSEAPKEELAMDIAEAPVQEQELKAKGNSIKAPIGDAGDNKSSDIVKGNSEPNQSLAGNVREENNQSLTITALEEPYQVEVKDQQLIVYKAKEEVFRSAKWEEGLEVRWQFLDENRLQYTLINPENNQVKQHIINLNKQEEKK